MKKTFYDWCIETDNTYLLDLWDYELNDCGPNEISYALGIEKRMYFKCPRGIHPSELYTICNITGSKHQKVTCRRCNSFGQWCVDNDKLDLLKRWDCELNKISPFDVSRASGKKYYFKCPVNNPLHPSEPKTICNLIKQEGTRRCTGCNSFGQWCVDNVDKDFMQKYWSDKNTINPFTILPAHSKNRVWIKCQKKDYHGDYDISPHNFVIGERCPYCTSARVNYCDSLGYSFIHLKNYWSDKNAISPFEVAKKSNKVYIFHCDIHGDYPLSAIQFYENGGACSACLREANISVLQKKVEDYIGFLNFNCLHEYKCNLKPINPKTNRQFRYDNEIPELKLIIESHGEQHYEITHFTKMTANRLGITPEEALEYQKWTDEYKKQFAVDNGYEFLEIPYWTDDKNETYKKLIDDKINEILIKNSSVTTAGGIEQSVS